MAEKKQNFLTTNSLNKLDYALFGAVALFCFLMFCHPDIMETAKHSFILLKSTFEGEFFNFYFNVEAYKHGLSYINAANYNVLIYAVFAVWELPFYLFELITKIPVGESTALFMWAKALSVGVYIGCGFMVEKICIKLGLSKHNARFGNLFFLLNPISFFGSVVFGQYEAFGIFFVLFALCAYFDKKYYKFALILGVAICFKFFPLLLVLPLILLIEKRPLHILKLSAVSLWLYVPTTLLFMGRIGKSAGAFTNIMIERLLAPQMEAGASDLPYFLIVYALVLFYCYLYRSAQQNTNMTALHACLVTYGALLTFILWHPQWVALVIPFMVITTMLAKNKIPYLLLDLAFALGFFVLTVFNFPGSCEANLFDLGYMHAITNSFYALSAAPSRLLSYYNLVPYLSALATVLFAAPIMLQSIFKFNLNNGTLGDTIGVYGLQNEVADLNLRHWLYITFFGGFVAIYLLPVCYAYMRTVF